VSEITLEQFNELKRKYDWIYAKYVEQQDSIEENNMLDSAGVSAYKLIRNTYVFNGNDSLDATYPYVLDFEIVDEMTRIASVKLSFKISDFRAYSKAAASGGGSTSGSGGGQTSSSGGDDTTQEPSAVVGVAAGAGWIAHADGYLMTKTYNVASEYHTHSQPTHKHTISNHTHTTPNHTHNLTFGIYEDDQSPTISLYIDNGSGYGGKIGDYTKDKLGLEITSYITNAGFKKIKFESDTLARIQAWVMCKIDVRV